jgi:hypothetical protein
MGNMGTGIAGGVGSMSGGMGMTMNSMGKNRQVRGRMRNPSSAYRQASMIALDDDREQFIRSVGVGGLESTGVGMGRVGEGGVPLGAIEELPSDGVGGMVAGEGTSHDDVLAALAAGRQQRDSAIARGVLAARKKRMSVMLFDLGFLSIEKESDSGKDSDDSTLSSECGTWRNYQPSETTDGEALFSSDSEGGSDDSDLSDSEDDSELDSEDDSWPPKSKRSAEPRPSITAGYAEMLTGLLDLPELSSTTQELGSAAQAKKGDVEESVTESSVFAMLFGESLLDELGDVTTTEEVSCSESEVRAGTAKLASLDTKLPVNSISAFQAQPSPQQHLRQPPRQPEQTSKRGKHGKQPKAAGTTLVPHIGGAGTVSKAIVRAVGSGEAATKVRAVSVLMTDYEKDDQLTVCKRCFFWCHREVLQRVVLGRLNDLCTDARAEVWEEWRHFVAVARVTQTHLEDLRAKIRSQQTTITWLMQERSKGHLLFLCKVLGPVCTQRRLGVARDALLRWQGFIERDKTKGAAGSR